MRWLTWRRRASARAVAPARRHSARKSVPSGLVLLRRLTSQAEASGIGDPRGDRSSLMGSLLCCTFRLTQPRQPLADRWVVSQQALQSLQDAVVANPGGPFLK